MLLYPRLAATRLGGLTRAFPAVLILGARQVGKTTLARSSFPGVTYIDLEEPFTREQFSQQPTFALQRLAGGPVILDEAQAVPAVFPVLRGLIDANPTATGRFIVLGSAQPALVRQVSETLAGRVGILDLDPLTAVEVSSGTPHLDWKDVWLRGGFPAALRMSFREWWEAYLRTYIERDLPHLGLTTDPLLLRRLLTMLAHVQGGLLKLSSLGDALGVSYHTVRRYLDVLEGTFLIRRLPPYRRNVGKRLVKSPKVYLRDTGMLHHLLNLNDLDAVLHHPVCGKSFETFIVEDLLRRERLRAAHSQFFFWRTAAGAEVDLVIERGSERFLVEVKSGNGGRPRELRVLEQCRLDIEARTVTIVDQADGVESLTDTITRRGFESSLEWLP